MKISTNLKRSRHGIFYYRAIVPNQLKAKLGVTEIKRSLYTREPSLAKLYAQYLNLTLRTGLLSYAKLLSLNEDQLTQIPMMMQNLNGIDINNIRTWTLKTPNGFVLEADPSNPDDLISAEKIAKNIFGNQTASPAVTNLQNSASHEKMSDVIPGWIARLAIENPKQKTIDEYVSKVNTFKQFVDNISVNNISAKRIAGFVNALSNGDITNYPLSASSINKYICALTSFFKHAIREGAWPEDKPLPTQNQRIKHNNKTKSQSYLPFDTNELNKIFNPENINWKNIGGNDFRPHMLWLPLLALFTGARIEELCQLSVDNIYQDSDSVWIIDINEEDNRQLKTAAAIRKIPLHPTLIKLGFLTYITEIKTHFKDEKLIFPYLIQNKYGKYSDVPSKWFGRYLDKLGIINRRKVFHSFRSTANNLLKEAGISEETRCQMVGHEYGSINSKNYSNAYSPKWLFENVIPKMNYSNIDFAALSYKELSHKTLIEKLLLSKKSVIKHKEAKLNKSSRI